jgi:hypothetical protein
VSLPDWLEALLPGETAATWEQIAPLVPAQAYLGGGTAIAVHLRHRPSQDLDFFFHEPTVDLDRLAEALQAHGPFAVTQRAPGTLNGLYGQTASSSSRRAWTGRNAASDQPNASAACRSRDSATCSR